VPSRPAQFVLEELSTEFRDTKLDELRVVVDHQGVRAKIV
jgi:hypothetical protein